MKSHGLGDLNMTKQNKTKQNKLALLEREILGIPSPTHKHQP
jgi:hypothetical protein